MRLTFAISCLNEANPACIGVAMIQEMSMHILIGYWMQLWCIEILDYECLLCGWFNFNSFDFAGRIFAIAPRKPALGPIPKSFQDEQCLHFHTDNESRTTADRDTVCSDEAFLWVAMGHGTGTKVWKSIEHGTKPNYRCSLVQKVAKHSMVCTSLFMKWGKSGSQRSKQLGMLIKRNQDIDIDSFMSLRGMFRWTSGHRGYLTSTWVLELEKWYPSIPTWNIFFAFSWSQRVDQLMKLVHGCNMVSRSVGWLVIGILVVLLSMGLWGIRSVGLQLPCHMRTAASSIGAFVMQSLILGTGGQIRSCLQGIACTNLALGDKNFWCLFKDFGVQWASKRKSARMEQKSKDVERQRRQLWRCSKD